jgi:hypothetical protein
LEFSLISLNAFVLNNGSFLEAVTDHLSPHEKVLDESDEYILICQDALRKYRLKHKESSQGDERLKVMIECNEICLTFAHSPLVCSLCASICLDCLEEKIDSLNRINEGYKSLKQIINQ